MTCIRRDAVGKQPSREMEVVLRELLAAEDRSRPCCSAGPGRPRRAARRDSSTLGRSPSACPPAPRLLGPPGNAAEWGEASGPSEPSVSEPPEGERGAERGQPRGQHRQCQWEPASLKCARQRASEILGMSTSLTQQFQVKKYILRKQSPKWAKMCVQGYLIIVLDIIKY